MGNSNSSPVLAGVKPTQPVDTAELNACGSAYVRLPACQSVYLHRIAVLSSNVLPVAQDVKRRGELSEDLAARALTDFARAAGVNTDKKRIQRVVRDAAGPKGKVRFEELVTDRCVACRLFLSAL